MNNCPHCGHRSCSEFVRDVKDGELVACCACGQEYVIRGNKR